MIKYTCKVCGDSGIVPAEVIAAPCCENCGSRYLELREVETQKTII